VVMVYVQFSQSLKNVENLLFECMIGQSHETVRMRWTDSVRCSRETQ
jgi:transposase-like protein